MLKVTFIKDHPSGIKKGNSYDFPKAHSKRLIAEGFCELFGAKKEVKKKSKK